MQSDRPTVALGVETLDRLMPMHLLIRPSGHIERVAPTLARLQPGRDLVGRRFLEAFELRRPRRNLNSVADLGAIAGTALRLQFRDPPHTNLKGILLARGDGAGFLVNLSFGLSVIEAVRAFQLTNGDFAPTDLAIEMLYMVEAKTAVMEESRKLNQRLESARLAAEEQAVTDMLTGLRNRRAMDKVLARLTASGTSFGLMHLDLDHFKAVNDTLGHAAGDHVLQKTAEILRQETRKGDTVARVGGDEFVLIFEGLTDRGKLMNIAQRIVRRLEEPLVFQGRVCRISGSIGFTTSDFYDRPDLDRMLSDADVALYASKHRGRACTTMVTEELLKEARMGARGDGLPTDDDPAARTRH